MDRQSPAAPAAPAADTTHDSDFAVSAPRAGVPVRPTAPTGFMVAAEASDALALEWRWDGDAAALRGFDISRRVGQVWQRIAVLDGDARDYLDRELMPDTRYEYQVVAVGAGGVSDAVAATGSTWPQSLGSVTNLRAEVDPRGVRLRWQENNVDEREVVIERLAPGTAVFEVLGRLGAGASHVTFMDHHLLVPGVYSYRVKSVGAEGDSAYAGLTVRFARTEERTVWLPMMYQFRRR